MTKSTRIPLLKVNEKINGATVYSGLFKAKTLIGHCEVPAYDPDASGDGGYQRLFSQRRVDEIRDLILSEANSLNLDAFMSPVNLNIRNTDALQYINAHSEEEELFVFEFTPTFSPIYIVDGQHRLLGLKAAYNKCIDNKDPRQVPLGDFLVPGTLTISDDETSEAFQFYLINEKQKKVSTDGAQRLLVNGYQRDHDRFKDVIKDIDKVRCGVAVDRLAQDSEIWCPHLRDFNETGKQKVSRSAFADASKHFYKWVYAARNGDERETIDLFVRIMEAFWSGFFALEGFDAMINPSTAGRYAIFKSSQVEVLLRVLTHFVDIWVDESFNRRFGSTTDTAVWTKILEPLVNYQEQCTGGGKHRYPVKLVSGSDCWVEGPAGAMGKYTSISAKRSAAFNLIEHIERFHGIHKTSAAAY